MWIIWQNLKSVKAALKGLNKKEFVDTTKKVQKLRGDLESVQAEMRNTTSTADMFETEKDIRMQLEKWSMIKESAYKQKLSVQWLKLGDTTDFFFASMKGRPHRIRSKCSLKKMEA